MNTTTVIAFHVAATTAYAVVLDARDAPDGTRTFRMREGSVPSKIALPADGCEGAQLIAFEQSIGAAIELSGAARVALLTTTGPAAPRAKMEGVIAMAAEARGVPLGEVHVNTLRAFSKKHGASPTVAPLVVGFAYLRDVKLTAVCAMTGGKDA